MKKFWKYFHKHTFIFLHMLFKGFFFSPSLTRIAKVFNQHRLFDFYMTLKNFFFLYFLENKVRKIHFLYLCEKVFPTRKKDRKDPRYSKKKKLLLNLSINFNLLQLLYGWIFHARMNEYIFFSSSRNLFQWNQQFLFGGLKVMQWVGYRFLFFLVK